MKNFVLSCCSTVDLSEEHLKKLDVNYVCFHFSLNGKQYDDDLGKTMSYEEFYNALKSGAETKTSQVNVSEFINYFTPFLERGLDILHISLSSGISGAYNSAVIAKEELSAKYPERKIYIVDSLCASSGYGLLMDKVASLRDEGKTIEEIYNWANENKLKLNHWFFSTDLSYFVKGGRISKTAGLIGSILKICPLLNMNSQGKLTPIAKPRSKEKAMEELLKRMEDNAIGGLEYNEKCYICHSDCLDDAKKVASLIENKFKKLNGKVLINSIGTTIGSHSGPGTIAIFFWGKDRV